MSKEMWDFSDDGQTYFDKTIKFLGDTLSKWKVREVNHSLTIALFSRVYFGDPVSGKQFKCSPLRDAEIYDVDTYENIYTSPHQYIRHWPLVITYIWICSQRFLEQDPNTDFVYEDYYKVILENETRSDWESLLPLIKSEMYNFSQELKVSVLLKYI